MKLTAVGYSDAIQPDYAEARRALGALLAPGQTFELRALPYGRSQVCRSANEAIKAIEEFRHSSGIYYTLNPCRPDLDGSAKDVDITCRRLFLVDIDPERPREASSNDHEKTAAKGVALAVLQYLASEGWPYPAMVDSGNGYHLIYRVDLPNDKLARQWMKSILEALSKRFDTPEAKIDRSVHNASRIAKLPGTWARKGQDTPDRPHRMARLVFTPDTFVPVPLDCLQAIATPPKADEPAPASTLRLKATGGSVAAYCQAALQGECGAVALATEGRRNEVLNLAAFKLGGLIHCGVFSRDEAASQLTHAAKRAGLTDIEIRATINSGLDAGIAEPREVEGRGEAKPAAVATAAVVASGTPLIVRASSITPRKVEFLWPGRVPLGKMTTFAGQGGLGKTLVLCDLAARVSRGGELPFSGGECATAGNVLFISGEDDEDDTLVPRLMEAGADLNRVMFLSAAAQDNFTLAALDLLTSVLDQVGDVRLVVVDPPASYMGDVDDHKNAEVRSVLTPIKRWANDKRLSVIFNTHVNKGGQNAEAAARVMGSVAWVNAVRAAHMFIRDSDDPDKVLFAPIKINIAKRPKGMVYRIVEGEAGPKVEWIEEVDKTADDGLSKDRAKPRQREAAEWLVEVFTGQREIESEHFWRSAKENGISRRSLDDFRLREGWPKCRKVVPPDGSAPFWIWHVPPEWSPVDGIPF